MKKLEVAQAFQPVDQGRLVVPDAFDDVPKKAHVLVFVYILGNVVGLCRLFVVGIRRQRCLEDVPDGINVFSGDVPAFDDYECQHPGSITFQQNTVKIGTGDDLLFFWRFLAASRTVNARCRPPC
ncbi:MAG: hypothetical protein EPN26_10645 [Rhodospirillales bacterium]|nr:MAG: hypothetical protein EPN26_10645 [Rhodospirillales bacterium]